MASHQDTAGKHQIGTPGSSAPSPEKKTQKTGNTPILGRYLSFSSPAGWASSTAAPLISRPDESSTNLVMAMLMQINE